MSRNPWSKYNPTFLRNVHVCRACKRASCVQGVWPCATPSRALLLPIETLRYLDRELESFWTAESVARNAPALSNAAAKES